MLKIVADDKIPFLRGALEPYAEKSHGTISFMQTP